MSAFSFYRALFFRSVGLVNSMVNDMILQIFV